MPNTDLHTYINYDYRDVLLITFYLIVTGISNYMGLLYHLKFSSRKQKLSFYIYWLSSNNYRAATLFKLYLTVKGIYIIPSLKSTFGPTLNVKNLRMLLIISKLDKKQFLLILIIKSKRVYYMCNNFKWF